MTTEPSHSTGTRERGPNISPLLCREDCFEISRCVSIEYDHTFAEMQIRIIPRKDVLHGYLREPVGRRPRVWPGMRFLWTSLSRSKCHTTSNFWPRRTSQLFRADLRFLSRPEVGVKNVRSLQGPEKQPPTAVYIPLVIQITGGRGVPAIEGTTMITKLG